jgi:NAD(P)-dependent dehydrogenase (short-subunit alcohol dehydrogenase family)
MRVKSGRLITGRWGEPEDMAKIVSAFARGDLDYSTGERIEVGGGLGISRW